jgi:hypothetical protein
MRNQRVLAHLYLNAVLPQFEELVALDPGVRDAVKDWNCTIQFHTLGGPGVHLVFQEGKCTARLGTTPWPTIALWFPSCEAVNRLFENRGFSVPVVWKGLWHPQILSRFTKLVRKLDYYLKPAAERLNDPAFRSIHVRLSLLVALFGIKAVGENDPQMKKVIAATPNGTMEVRVVDGLVAHLTIQDGTVTPVKGPAKDPTVAMEIKDDNVAFGLVNNQVDPMEALCSGDIRIKGLLPMADNLSMVMDSISKYLV